MKKQIFLATLLLATLSGCSDDIYQSDSIAEGGSQVSFIVDEFTYGDGTRASYTPRDDRYQFSWTEGDTLGVFGTETPYQVEFPIGNNTIGNKVSFDGGNFGVRPEHSYVAYYPYDYDRILSFTGMNTTTQMGNGSTVHLSKQDIMASVYTPVDKNGNVNFEMKHLCSLLCFEVNAPEIGTYTKLKVSCGTGVKFYSDYKYILGQESSKLEPDTKTSSSEYVVNLEDVTTTKADEIITVYAMIPSGKFRTDGLAFTLVIDDGTEFVYSSPTYMDGNKPVRNTHPVWEAGMAYKYKLDSRFTDDNGHEYVDMGIRDNDGEPIYFAACNLGANSPEEYGYYFAWGETTGYYPQENHVFEKSTYSLYDDNTKSYTKYVANVNGSGADLVLEDDAAATDVKWGGNWRMPTQAEYDELIKECTHEFTKIGDVDVLKFTSKLTGESIILPVAGACQDKLNNDGYYGFYWTSTLKESDANYGSSLIIYYKDPDSGWVADAIGTTAGFLRFYGCPIRPVYSMSQTQIQTITLNESSIEVKAKEPVKLIANISPEIATYKSLQWTSSDVSVATVAQDGTVTGVSEGIASITATARDDSNASATCEVRVFQNHEWVDLGLKAAADGKPIYWASCNIGADSPEDFGKYFAWGETKGYLEEESHTFNWANYTLGERLVKDNKYVYNMYKYNIDEDCGIVDNVTVLDPEDDAAFVLWGDNWRMPTMSEVDDLIYGNGTSHVNKDFEVLEDIQCVNIKSANGESLLLPIAGIRQDNINDTGTKCYYWSASLDITSEGPFSQNARAIYVNKSLSDRYIASVPRFNGCPIRPVYHEYQRIQGIKLNADAIGLREGGTYDLVATISPANAYYKRLSWYSLDENIATVDQNGKVTAVASGTTTIVAKAKDRSGVTATCKVNVSISNDHQYVDLGIKDSEGNTIYWATCNIGASSSIENGLFFAWGETQGYTETDKHEFNTNGYLYYNNWYTKYIISGDGKTQLEPQDDAAHVIWGGRWRMPTYDEMNMLLTECLWSTDMVGGKYIYVGTSKHNGNKITIPNTGLCQERLYINAHNIARLWTSSLGSETRLGTCITLIANVDYSMIESDRYMGYPIRPVRIRL